MKYTKVGVLAASAVLVFSACSSSSTTAPSESAAASESAGASSSAGGGTGNCTVNIATELPMQGSELAASQPIINGVKTALNKVGNKAGDCTINFPDSAQYDDALNGAHDPQTGAKNMTTITSDPSYMAVIGPVNSNVAAVQIPISNEAGLLQCSPANTNPGLTQPEFGALDIRKARPNDINYIRVVTTDNYQGPAAAAYIYGKLGKKTVYIIDDTETFGKGIADAFEAEFKKEGGTVVAHDGVPKTTTDYTSILTQAAAKKPEAIYFGGVTATGGARILNAAVQAGMGDIPFVGPDGISDGSATTKDSFLNLAGANAKNAYSTLAGIGDFPAKAQFDADYKALIGTDPTGYAAMGYACAQVVLDAIARASQTADPTDLAAFREAVRKAAVDPSVSYDTILGKLQFDANGDTTQKIISIYAYDPAGANGAGDWAFKEQIDFAQAGQ
jgi:branched-chain amino acid transport system substrate-binding protein